jgi:hypothetical protein
MTTSRASPRLKRRKRRLSISLQEAMSRARRSLVRPSSSLASIGSEAMDEISVATMIATISMATMLAMLFPLRAPEVCYCSGY